MPGAFGNNAKFEGTRREFASERGTKEGNGFATRVHFDPYPMVISPIPYGYVDKRVQTWIHLDPSPGIWVYRIVHPPWVEEVTGSL